jgi:hypothetical protein
LKKEEQFRWRRMYLILLINCWSSGSSTVTFKNTKLDVSRSQLASTTRDAVWADAIPVSIASPIVVASPHAVCYAGLVPEYSVRAGDAQVPVVSPVWRRLVRVHVIVDVVYAHVAWHQVRQEYKRCEVREKISMTMNDDTIGKYLLDNRACWQGARFWIFGLNLRLLLLYIISPSYMNFDQELTFALDAPCGPQ